MVSVLEKWKAQRIAKNFCADTVREAVEAQYASIPPTLDDRLKSALRDRGIERLYTHQVRSYELATQGNDIVVATPTASGKSLCYNLPILDHLVRDHSARALYLFPTKALARDQEQRLHALLKDVGVTQGAVTYDGDTPWVTPTSFNKACSR